MCALGYLHWAAIYKKKYDVNTVARLGEGLTMVVRLCPALFSKLPMSLNSVNGGEIPAE